MSLKVALQMDHIADVNIDADSTFAIGLEAERRGHELFFYHPNDLMVEDGRVMAWAQRLQLRRELGNHCTLGTAELMNVSTFDVVWLRQDPPFDMAYITTTYLLDMLPSTTLVVNNPTEVRNNSEKLYITRFPDLVPPTLVSRNVLAIKAFREKHTDIIVKPLYGNGGAGVFHVKPGDENLSSLLEMFFAANREPVIVQAYLKDVRQGDKRIILVDGKPVGAINRVPQDGEARSNMHAGGTPEPSKLTERDLYICRTIGADLSARGLLFAGIDVIGEYLTEINVTSPTGLQEIRRFDGIAIEEKIWDAIETKLNG
ncbi:glutathione synthase [Magnetovibrio blakemorei]|uniref:Glutathione synthetase n=1 Tax=Magnetovibrio blakemorei TaxID=28181 RepID=A0A1E5Q412_9PROT|nr:glutathione synthase [Magnetovibrio blakemorei]OEJ64383.1 glutathione synthase [Magnetovibrio blakemorei]